MRWMYLGALALCLLFLVHPPQAQGQAQPPPCTPPPGTSNLIACYGNTPCPAGYLDPVGLAQRNIRQNWADPNGTPWLCIQQPSSQNSSDSGQNAGSASAPPPASSAPAPPASVVTTPVITTTLGLDKSGPLAPYLTDNQGMTVYIRTSDQSGASSCYNSCALIWPPVAPPSGNLTLPDGASGTLATLSRSDGTSQVTYNGMPLYTYTGDVLPGDTNGQGLDATTAQGVSGVWKVATP